MIAFIPSLGWQEMFLLLVVGLLLYGRNLPEAGRNLGRVVAQLKRSFHDFKDQIDREGELRDVKKAIQDTAREVKNVTRVPTAVANPGDALRELTLETMSSPLPGEEAETDDEATDEVALDEVALDEVDFPDATDADHEPDGALADEPRQTTDENSKP